MKRLIPLALLLLVGCSIVPTDTGWPKPTWYWSYEAKQRRAEKQTAKEWKARQQELDRAQTNKPTSQFLTGDSLIAMVQKRDGTNFIGVYMGMIAEWDGSTSVFVPETDANGQPVYGGNGHMVPNMKPQGVQMFSATSGEMLKWIPYEDFRDIFVLKIKSEYP